MRKISAKIIDFFAISTFYLSSILPSLVFSLPPLALNIIWFIIPTIYLLFRLKKNLIKIFAATLPIGLLGFSLDIFLLHNHAWTPYNSSFSIRIFGAPIEEMLWFFFHIFYTLIFYEHFFDDENIFSVSRRFKYLAGTSFFIFFLSLFFIYGLPDVSRIRYAYLTIGIIAMMPILIYLFGGRMDFLKKLIPLGVFFFLFAMIMEIQALRFGLWSFPDVQNYLGLVTFFGVAFPIEELIFWMILGPSAAIAYYEIFADDNK